MRTLNREKESERPSQTDQGHRTTTSQNTAKHGRRHFYIGFHCMASFKKKEKRSKKNWSIFLVAIVKELRRAFPISFINFPFLN
jgi:hypothetical protein